MIFKAKTQNQKVASNAFFYFFYQCILFVAPLVILPYITRVLSDSVLGEYNFSYSIAYYFVLASNLGISTYGQREIASAKGDKELINKRFWSLFSVHAFFSIVSSVSYIVFASTNVKSVLYVCLMPYVFSALFDVTWFFYGLENFKLVTIVNALFSLLKVVLIFTLIKNNGHLWIYQLISFGIIFSSQLTIFLLAFKTIGRPQKFGFKDCLRHIKPIMYFALSVIALSMYTNFDKTLMGLLINDQTRSVAYYEYADKIVAVPRMIITVLSTVLYPRICALTKESNSKQIGLYTIFSLDWVTFLSCLSIFGILALGVPFCIIYYGKIYEISGYAMMMMSPLIFIISLGSVCRTQFILPNKKDGFFLISIIMNAIINVSLNFVLIKPMGLFGVILASLISESIALCFQMIVSRKAIDFRFLAKSLFVYGVSGFTMFVVLVGTSKLFSNMNWLTIIIQVLIGCVIFVLVSTSIAKLSNHTSFLFRLRKKEK